MNYAYQVIASQRQIGGPEEITLWDLENLCTELVINYEVMEDFTDQRLVDSPVLDAGLLRLMPSLRTFTTYYPLEDYSVFEGMEQLEHLKLHIDGETTLDLSTLRVGKAETLSIEGFRRDIALDLSGCDVETLRINSWVAGVTGFRGCEGVKNLDFNNTRTDTRLITAEVFPNLETIQMAFFSDTPRVRDFSQLATFGEDVFIHLTLSYQACNDKTIESLEGVQLDYLTLDPENGQWPLEGQPDPALVEKVNAKEVEWVKY